MQLNVNDIAGHLLQVEQRLIAYQKLHNDELAQLWRTLNQCKREIATVMSELQLEVSDLDPTLRLGQALQGQTEEEQETS